MMSMATRLVTAVVMASVLGLSGCASSDRMMGGGDKMDGDKLTGDKTMMKDDTKKGDSMMEKK
jgi:hypothetical protein